MTIASGPAVRLASKDVSKLAWLFLSGSEVDGYLCRSSGPKWETSAAGRALTRMLLQVHSQTKAGMDSMPDLGVQHWAGVRGLHPYGPSQRP